MQAPHTARQESAAQPGRSAAGVALRAALAVAGGYALTAAGMALLARTLPVTRVEAVIAATLLSFLCYALIAMACFGGVRQGVRQAMAWLHAWTGLLTCWVLLLVFASGTASYYRDEISAWMRPELRAAAPAAAAGATSPAILADAALRALQDRAPGAARWSIELPDERNPFTTIGWSDAAGKRPQTALLDPASGAALPAPRDTLGGDFFFRLHFDLHYMPKEWGRWIVGVCAMFMLVAILSGVVTHRRIFADFFTFRPRKGQRSWLDAHNALAVLALPFHLLITYTGLVTLMFMYMPFPKQALYGADQKTWLADAYPGTRHRVKSPGAPAAMTPLAPLLASAGAYWQGAAPARIDIHHPGKANAMVAITRGGGAQLSNTEPAMYFSGADGRLLAREDYSEAGASETRRALYGLHVGRFADPLLRALLFACSLAGCAMVATGALLWGVKRRRDAAAAPPRSAARGHPGLRLVDALNLGAIAGLPLAFGACLWSNRLLPAGLAGRAELEVLCFFGAWAAAAVLAQISPTLRMWRWQLGCAAALLCAIPLLDAATAPRIMPLFDAVLAGLGALLGYAAWRLKRQAGRKGAPA